MVCFYFIRNYFKNTFGFYALLKVFLYDKRDFVIIMHPVKSFQHLFNYNSDTASVYLPPTWG